MGISSSYYRGLHCQALTAQDAVEVESDPLLFGQVEIKFAGNLVIMKTTESIDTSEQSPAKIARAREVCERLVQSNLGKALDIDAYRIYNIGILIAEAKAEATNG